MSTDRRISRSTLSIAVAQALGAATSLGLAGPALSQEAKAQLAPVIVTAQRREQDILDVPYNISSVSGDEIALRQTLDTPELLRGIAGVSMVDRGQRNAAVVSGIRIRGLNVDSNALGDYAVSAVSTVSETGMLSVRSPAKPMPSEPSTDETAPPALPLNWPSSGSFIT